MQDRVCTITNTAHFPENSFSQLVLVKLRTVICANENQFVFKCPSKMLT